MKAILLLQSLVKQAGSLILGKGHINSRYRQLEMPMRKGNPMATQHRCIRVTDIFDETCRRLFVPWTWKHLAKMLLNQTAPIWQLSASRSTLGTGNGKSICQVPMNTTLHLTSRCSNNG